MRNSILILLTLLLGGCIESSTSESSSKPAAGGLYTPPSAPNIFTTDQERREYITERYWENFNFRDTTMRSSMRTEQAYINYLHTLQGVSAQSARRSIDNMMNRSLVDSLMFERMIEIGEKFLYNPNSIYRNEELYIALLQYIIGSEAVDEIDKMRPQYQLRMALRNRVGEVAADFAITTDKGAEVRLSQIEADYIVILFNNPDCHDCARVKDFIVANRAIFERAKIIAVYTDSDLDIWRKTEYPESWINGYDSERVINTTNLYYLQAIPTLYLVDREHRVVLKDAPVEIIAQYLSLQPSHSTLPRPSGS